MCGREIRRADGQSTLAGGLNGSEDDASSGGLLFLGVLQVTVGCALGFIPPTAVQWFRGIVMAHIEFTANGVLMVALGLLVMNMELGATGLKAWFVTMQIGTWSNGAAGPVGAFIGYSSRLMATLNATFPSLQTAPTIRP